MENTNLSGKTNYLHGIESVDHISEASTEQREERNKKRRLEYKKGIQKESAEQKEERNKKRRSDYQKGIQNEIIQQKQERGKKRHQTYENRVQNETTHQKEERNKKRRQEYKDGVQNETTQQKEEYNKKRRQKYKDGVQNESTQQKEELNKKRRQKYKDGIQNETPQQKEERNKKRRQKYKDGHESQKLDKLVCDDSKSIIRTFSKFAVLPLMSKRMRTNINNKKKNFALSNTILDIGPADRTCSDCGALMWKLEQTKKQQQLNSDKFSLCCGNGKVSLPLLKETPSELKSLLDGTSDKSVIFRKYARLYNDAFAFTSVGANLDKNINDGRGPDVYRLHGQTYHQIGSLLPHESEKPVFSQIYMYDNQQQLEERLNFPNNDDKLDIEITTSLSSMLHRENALVDIYRHVRDRFKDTDYVPAKLRLVANRETDGRESNIPINAYEFAALIADDNLSDNRDIVVDYKGGGLHRISVLHPCFMSLQYPLLFPYGEDGYRLEILHVGVSYKSGNRRYSVTMREYYCFRLQYRIREGHTLLGGGRIFLQFVVDAWACIEHTRLMWVKKNQKILRSELYNNIVDSVHKGDTDATVVGKRIVLPSSFTGSPRYMQQNYQDCMAICTRFGSPDLFITFTCNSQWPEIKQYCDKIPNCSPCDRPDILARVFKIKLDLLLEDLTDKHVLGKVIGGMSFINQL